MPHGRYDSGGRIRRWSRVNGGCRTSGHNLGGFEPAAVMSLYATGWKGAGGLKVVSRSYASFSNDAARCTPTVHPISLFFLGCVCLPARPLGMHRRRAPSCRR